MNKARQTLAAALAIPLIGMTASWFVTHSRAQQGVDWEVPVQGYDPRDLLRGHFISYRYAWPGLDANEGDDYSAVLCIRGTAPVISQAVQIPAEGQHDNCASIARPNFAIRHEVQGLRSGILYIDQKKAGPLQTQLSDPKLEGIVLIRVRADGQVRPLSIRFRARQNLPEPPDE